MDGRKEHGDEDDDDDDKREEEEEAMARAAVNDLSEEELVVLERKANDIAFCDFCKLLHNIALQKNAVKKRRRLEKFLDEKGLRVRPL